MAGQLFSFLLPNGFPRQLCWYHGSTGISNLHARLVTVGTDFHLTPFVPTLTISHDVLVVATDSRSFDCSDLPWGGLAVTDPSLDKKKGNYVSGSKEFKTQVLQCILYMHTHSEATPLMSFVTYLRFLLYCRGVNINPYTLLTHHIHASRMIYASQRCKNYLAFFIKISIVTSWYPDLVKQTFLQQ